MPLRYHNVILIIIVVVTGGGGLFEGGGGEIFPQFLRFLLQSYPLIAFVVVVLGTVGVGV